jgi:dienelactone hydrolase
MAWAHAASGFVQPSAPPAGFSLPAPTGPSAVGTTSWSIRDESRREAFGGGEERAIKVVAWYPTAASANGARAPYFREGAIEGRTFAALMKQPETIFDDLADARTVSLLDAPPRSGERLPVLVFSHGYTAIASSYTALMEDLASHGYAVLSILHPYEVLAVTMPDGHVVRMLDDKGQMRRGILDVLGEWSQEDETMAQITTSPSEDERLRVMRQYLAGLSQTGAALDRWVVDTRVVLDRLDSALEGAASQLASALDLQRVGFFGHSMGGVTAAQACLVDERCKGALNLDGIPQYGPMIDARMTRPLLMVYSSRKGRLGASDVIYRRAAASYTRVDVDDTLHNSFSDMILWGGPLRGRPIFGAIAPERAIAVTRQIVREFFDQTLRGRKSALLSGAEKTPGVTVR